MVFRDEFPETAPRRGQKAVRSPRIGPRSPQAPSRSHRNSRCVRPRARPTPLRARRCSPCKGSRAEARFPSRCVGNEGKGRPPKRRGAGTPSRCSMSGGSVGACSRRSRKILQEADQPPEGGGHSQQGTRHQEEGRVPPTSGPPPQGGGNEDRHDEVEPEAHPPHGGGVRLLRHPWRPAACRRCRGSGRLRGW